MLGWPVPPCPIWKVRLHDFDRHVIVKEENIQSESDTFLDMFEEGFCNVGGAGCLKPSPESASPAPPYLVWACELCGWGACAACFQGAAQHEHAVKCFRHDGLPAEAGADGAAGETAGAGAGATGLAETAAMAEALDAVAAEVEAEADEELAEEEAEEGILV